MTWHLDGGEVHKNSEWYFWNFGSLLAHVSGSSSLDARFLCAPIPSVIMKIPEMKQRVILPDFGGF